MTKEQVREYAESLALKVEIIEPFTSQISFANTIFDSFNTDKIAYFGVCEIVIRGSGATNNFVINAIKRSANDSSHIVSACNYISSVNGVSYYFKFHGFFQNITSNLLVTGSSLSFVGYRLKLTKNSITN